MDLAHFRMLINELLDKDTDIVSEVASIIILDIKYAVCMDKNVKDNNHTRHISIRVHFLRSGEKCKFHSIDWFVVVLQVVHIATKNVGENYLNPGMKYIMASLDN